MVQKYIPTKTHKNGTGFSLTFKMFYQWAVDDTIGFTLLTMAKRRLMNKSFMV